MSIIQAIVRPFKRMLERIKTVNQQTYCEGSTNCDSLSYSKGNLDQTPHAKEQAWQNHPTPEGKGKHQA